MGIPVPGISSRTCSAAHYSLHCVNCGTYDFGVNRLATRDGLSGQFLTVRAPPPDQGRCSRQDYPSVIGDASPRCCHRQLGDLPLYPELLTGWFATSRCPRGGFQVTPPSRECHIGLVVLRLMRTPESIEALTACRTVHHLWGSVRRPPTPTSPQGPPPSSQVSR